MEQRELSFNEQNGYYISEEKVNADYNLHIEMEEEKGSVEIYQRGSDSGEYRRVYTQTGWGKVCGKNSQKRYACLFINVRFEDSNVGLSTKRK